MNKNISQNMTVIPMLDVKAQHEPIKEEIKQALKDILDSGQFILGPNVRSFEQEVAAFYNIKYTVGLASGTDALYLCLVRYGNVAGSRVSVNPRWRAMAAAGARRVPVTDPDCTRYYMTMAQACELVLGAALLTPVDPMRPIIPTLPAYRLGDLAEAMGVETEILGLPPSEKRHETMDGVTDSSQARRMTVDELQEALRHV